MEKSEVTTGAYTPYSTKISKEAKDIFQKATEDLVGVEYSPFAVACQIVGGTNFRFICNAKEVSPNAPATVAMIEIYQPINGIPRISEISRC
ncbi:hypothetical protein BZG01_16590 [Labilibaculum manganireducens]|uniref:Uncharacterized protein n=1 Tax=Labilibaculum manganireducens TaxID=1940525 RepID=A0A2N3HY57_9BACT|nr:hypothetical protein [Labilibaculum manganireducens]PKQ63000.1 hypothetical protein BZG01_16590 [Labilibaculum manganireducens]